MNSPFKFLDSYTLADRDIFFGRDQEITELYRKVFESKILLVYGISGTGKSSLVNCGLASRFDESDWLPVNVRRGNNIVSSLNEAISKQAITSLKRSKTFEEKLQSVYLDHFKPIYLIFDQFEELFIFGTRHEKTEFIKLIKEVLESKTQCRIIFIIREEFLAGITEFEYDLPEIFSNRFRVEKMKRANAIHAIDGPCKVHNIETEQGFSEELIDKLCPAGNEIELTYLQIYLDRILRLASEDYQTTQGGTDLSTLNYPPYQGGTKGGSPYTGGLHFTKTLLSRAGNVSDLLGQFLEEQVREFEDPDTGMAILKSFVSVQGTKKQMTEHEILDSIATFGKSISESDLIKHLTKFVDLRILRERDEAGHFELRHDALAAKIFEKFTAIEKDIIEVRQFIENAYHDWQKRGELLSSSDLDYIAPYESRLYLSREVSGLIENSKKELVKVRRRRRNIVFAATIALLIIFAGFTIWALKERKNALFQQSQAIDSRNKAFESEKVAIEAKNKAVKSEEKAIESELEATKAKDLANESQKLTILEKNKAIAEGRRSKVLLLIAKAKESVETNPTKAIRFAELAYKSDSTYPLANQILSDIYNSSDSKPFYSVSFDHFVSVSSAVFSPDGNYILTASADKTAKLWDLSGKFLFNYSGHIERVNSAVFSPDGKNIITASGDYTVKIWEKSGKCVSTLIGHTQNVNSAIFSPDSRNILTCSNDGTAKLWDRSGKCISTLTGHISNVYSAVFSPDGKHILTAARDYTAKLWDLSGKCITTLSGYSSQINSAQFSPDGKAILIASNDNRARLWDLSGTCLTTFTGHSSFVNSAIFSPDGIKIITVSNDNTTKLWDLSGKCLATFSGHTSNVYLAAFSPDGLNILTASKDNTVKLWDLSGKCLASLCGYTTTINSITFSPDAKRILTASGDGSAKLWGLSKSFLTIGPHNSYISYANYSPDGNLIVTASYDKTSKIWDLSGKCIATLSGHNSSVYSAVFSPDGKNILTASADKTAKLWDLSGKCLVTFSVPNSSFNVACFSIDGNFIFTSSNDRMTRLWDFSGKCLTTFSGNIGGPETTAISPDSRNLLTTSGDNKVRLWDLSGKCLTTFLGHSNWVNSAIFSPDGKFILTSSDDKTVKLWDRSGNCLTTLTGHLSYVYLSLFSPDGRIVLTFSGDNTLKLWNLSGKCFATLTGHSGYIKAVFSPDSKYILSCTPNRLVKLWDNSGKCLVTFTGSEDFLSFLSIYRTPCFSPDSKRALTASSETTLKLWRTPSSISNWLRNAEISSLAPADKSDIGEIDGPETLINSNNLSLIMNYAYWYYRLNDFSKAEVYFEKALQLNPEIIDKLVLGRIYKMNNEMDKYFSILKDKPQEIIRDSVYSMPDTSGISNYSSRFYFFSKITRLSERILPYEPLYYNKKEIADLYYEMGRYGLFSMKYTEALKATQRGIELDSLNQMLYLNLPLCYLFNGMYEKAKSVFINYKDKPYLSSTYKEKFLAEIDKFEKAGIIHPDFEKVKALLSNDEKIRMIKEKIDSINQKQDFKVADLFLEIDLYFKRYLLDKDQSNSFKLDSVFLRINKLKDVDYRQLLIGLCTLRPNYVSNIVLKTYLSDKIISYYEEQSKNQDFSNDEVIITNVVNSYGGNTQRYLQSGQFKTALELAQKGYRIKQVFSIAADYCLALLYNDRIDEVEPVASKQKENKDTSESFKKSTFSNLSNLERLGYKAKYAAKFREILDK